MVLKRTIALLLALVFAAFTACTKGKDDAKDGTQDTDQALSADKLWKKQIKAETEAAPVNCDGYPAYILAGGKATVYVGDEPGARPILINRNGRKYEISITTRDGGTTEEYLGLNAKPSNFYSEEEIKALAGADLLWGSKHIYAYHPQFNRWVLTNNGSDWAFMFAQNDFGYLQGLVNCETGELMEAFSDGENVYYALSEHGGKILGQCFGSQDSGKLGVFDLSTSSVERTFAPREQLKREAPGADIYSDLGYTTFLGDGSIVGVCTAHYWVTDGNEETDPKHKNYVYIIDPKGNMQFFYLGEGQINVAKIVSNDPKYVIIACAKSGFMIDRANGSAKLLSEKNGKVSAADIPEEGPITSDDSMLVFKDWLDDGETLLFMNRDGALVMFRPDTMESKVITYPKLNTAGPSIAECSGDHKGTLLFTYLSGADGGPRSVYLELTDESGSPLIP